jgi:uncharacterized protein (DUF2252 family)
MARSSDPECRMSRGQIIEPRNRKSSLRSRQALKKARSVHAYVRGSAEKFYEWLDHLEPSALPHGPPVWICGDCHVGNLGPLEDRDGEVEIGIRDFDQAVIGNPVHDLLRLGLSLAAAARSSDLPGLATAHMLERMMEGYRAEFVSGKHPLPSRPDPVAVVMRRAHRRTWKHLARERLRGNDPKIPLGKHYWPLSRAESRAIEKLAQCTDVTQLVRSLNGRPEDCEVELLDAAFWVKGCSSLGRRRYAALLRVAETREAEAELCLIDIKEAVRACARPYARISMPRGNAQRVVEAAKALAPALGERMRPARILDSSVFVRELRPKDLKIELDALTQDEAGGLGDYLARIVGRAHARQMDAETRRNWHRELGSNRLRSIDTPGWLWSGIVRLLAEHETAYLEHCRRCALRAR